MMAAAWPQIVDAGHEGVAHRAISWARCPRTEQARQVLSSTPSAAMAPRGACLALDDRDLEREGMGPRSGGRYGGRPLLNDEPVNAAAGNAKSLGDGGTAHAVGCQLADFVRIKHWFAPGVDAPRLRRGDALQLAFFPQVGLELGEDT